jgi:hypothetical protein
MGGDMIYLGDCLTSKAPLGLAAVDVTAGWSGVEKDYWDCLKSLPPEDYGVLARGGQPIFWFQTYSAAVSIFLDTTRVLVVDVVATDSVQDVAQRCLDYLRDAKGEPIHHLSLAGDKMVLFNLAFPTCRADLTKNPSDHRSIGTHALRDLPQHYTIPNVATWKVYFASYETGQSSLRLLMLEAE